MPPRPLLVIVSGAPGAGKSTIVRQLAPALKLPLIAKDDIKETLGDAIPPSSAAESRALGTASLQLMFHLAEELLEAGVSLVLESNFYRGLQEEPSPSPAGASHCRPYPLLRPSRTGAGAI